MAPEILSTPEDVRTKEGESVRFHLRIFGEPEPKVEWYLNGQQLRKSKRFNLWFDGLYHLEINPGTARTLLLMLYWYKIRYKILTISYCASEIVQSWVSLNSE